MARAVHSFEDTFTATATAALEVGAMPYAKGLIDYHFEHYVRNDGLVWYRAVAVPASARMLTILALYHAYSGSDDATLLSRAPHDATLARHLQKCDS